MEASGKQYFSCLWPGLPELWYRGQWSALPAALAFGCALNFLLVARFLYPEWLAPLLVKLACWVALACWVYCVAKAIRKLPAVISPRTASNRPDRFSEAHMEYLRGHWVEAEALLIEGLEIESRDPPAMLLLAGIYRHTRRLAAAANVLEQLERMERADFWRLELGDERRRLERYQAAEQASPEDDSPEEDSPEEESSVQDSPREATPSEQSPAEETPAGPSSESASNPAASAVPPEADELDDTEPLDRADWNAQRLRAAAADEAFAAEMAVEEHRNRA